ncbi:uncharacterized protein LOC130569548 [Triplophysa rosa]|uniref:uncharacterized protein LOC130569548 n=1 Tax=Triplophysa rosa TaxID=992332 RepID=UPI002545DFDE|nr:uncharacterized protein LOC130569548 [Triplophysa rosa]
MYPGSLYWKQNARKVFVISEQDFPEFQGTKRKRSSSRKDDETSGLQDVYEKIEEVVLASQGLQQVISSIKELSELSSQTSAKTLTDVQMQKIKAAFTCIVCKGPIDQPVFATCCRSLIGCKLCVDQWMATASQCLKCRGEDLSNNVFLAVGLSEVLLALSDIIKELGLTTLPEIQRTTVSMQSTRRLQHVQSNVRSGILTHASRGDCDLSLLHPTVVQVTASQPAAPAANPGAITKRP